MDPALLALLTDTLLLAPLTGRDTYGKPIYGTARARKGRIERRMKTVITATGLELVLETRAFLDAEGDVTDTDQLTLPDGTTAPIQGVETVTDPFQGGQVDHYVLYL
jgi:hypothetical protein